jgi:hypothetical protein
LSKLVVMVLVAVLLGGAALYTIGGQIVPAAATAGTNTKAAIQNAFQ